MKANPSSSVNILLALGWAFTYFGQLVSRQAAAVEPSVARVLQAAATD